MTVTWNAILKNIKNYVNVSLEEKPENLCFSRSLRKVNYFLMQSLKIISEQKWSRIRKK